MGFPCSSAGEESACSAGDPSLIPGSGSSPGEGIGYPFQYSWAFLVAQLVKNLPALLETWVWSLGWEDPQRRKAYPVQYSGLENSMDCMGSQRHYWVTFTFTYWLDCSLLFDFCFYSYFLFIQPFSSVCEFLWVFLAVECWFQHLSWGFVFCAVTCGVLVLQ